MTEENRVFQRRTEEPGLVTRRIAGETIVVPVSARVGDLDSIYTFNEAGARVWALLERPISAQAIASALADEYDAPAAQIAADVAELLDGLQSRGLVRRVEPTGA